MTIFLHILTSNIEEMFSPDARYSVLMKAGMSLLEEIYMSLIPLAGPGSP